MLLVNNIPPSPVVIVLSEKNDKTENWECFVNIEDRTNSWHQLELERYEDIKTMLQEWVPLIEELEKVDLAEQSYRMKGYDW